MSPHFPSFLIAQTGFVANFAVWLAYARAPMGAILAAGCFLLTCVLYRRYG